MLLKNSTLKNKLPNYLFFLFFFLHIYFWDIKNILNAAEIEFFPLDFLRYLLLFFFFGVLINKKIFDKYFLILSLIFPFQIGINYFFYDQGLNLKEFGSIIFFLILYTIVKNEKDRILFYLKYFFELFILIIFLGSLSFLISGNYHLGDACNFILIDSIIYHENSHFAMMSTCMIIYYLYEEKNFRNIFFFTMLISASIFYVSLTFLLGSLVSLILCILVNIIHKHKNNISIIISIIIIIIAYNLKDQCSDRVKYLIKKTNINLKVLDKFDKDGTVNKNFESKSNIYNELLPYSNLSSQVYNIAIHNTLYTIKNRPIGWGFNSYNRLYDFNIMNIMKQYYDFEYEFNMKKHNYYQLINLNKNDARSTLLKIINEFGFFSIFFLITGIKFLLNKKTNIVYKLTISTLLITQLISGAGYFNGGFAIFLFLMIILSSSNEKI